MGNLDLLNEIVHTIFFKNNKSYEVLLGKKNINKNKKDEY